MKLALMSFISALFVTTHQQYFHYQPIREMPWLMPYSPQSLISKYQSNIFYYPARFNLPAIHQNENLYRAVMVHAAEDISKHLDKVEQPEISDIESRVKGFSSNGQANINNGGRFLFNLLSSTGTYTNSFFKTATFTVYSSVSLTSFVNCVPSTQVLSGVGATACRRKRSEGSSNHSSSGGNAALLLESGQYSISPSETLQLVPTDLIASPTSSDQQFSSQLSSSKDEANIGETSASSVSHFRKKRLFFLDKNQFVVSTTMTSYSFSNSTVTVTRSLLATPGQCLDVAAAVAVAVPPAVQAPQTPQCVACLPSGYVVCTAAAG